MRWCRLLVLLAPLAVWGAPLEDAAKKELEIFQGSWKAVAIQHADGRQACADEVQNTRLLIEGNKFTLTGKDFTISGTFTVNPAKTPKTIDVLLTSKDGREKRFLGIYQMQGDPRRSCFALPGKERPTEFSSEKGYFGFEWSRGAGPNPHTAALTRTFETSGLIATFAGTQANTAHWHRNCNTKETSWGRWI